MSPDLVAREYSFMNEGCVIGSRVELGPYVMLSPRVAIIGGDHRFDHPGVPVIFAGRPSLERTTVEADVWIGFGAIIKAGVPARRIAERFLSAEDCARHDAMLAEPPQAGDFAGPLGQG